MSFMPRRGAANDGAPRPVDAPEDFPENFEADYFERRAEQEVEMATRSTDNRAVQAHYDLATLYLDRIHPPATDPQTDEPPESEAA